MNEKEMIERIAQQLGKADAGQLELILDVIQAVLK